MKTETQSSGAPAPDRGGELDRQALAGLMHDLANEQFKLRGWLEMARGASNEAGRQWAIEKGLADLPKVRALLDRFDELRKGQPASQPPSPLGKITGEVIEETLASLAPTLPPEVELFHKAWLPELWLVAMSEGDLNRVLTNLVKNAAEAMPNGGRIVVLASNVEIAATGGIEPLAPGHYVLIGVHDTGPGIAPEAMARLFEPYATFGKEGGTGLGLASVKQLVEGCGGCVTCDSTPGRGARFNVWLPAMQG